jgi:predicted sulfurtransferase
VVHPAELARSAAPHVSPADFHQLLKEAELGESEKETVLLDTRNIYETRIGHFMVVRPHHRNRLSLTSRSWSSTRNDTYDTRIVRSLVARPRHVTDVFFF